MNEEITNALDDLVHDTDGPVTDFVVVSRAMQLAADKTYTPEVLANALFQALDLG